MSALSFRSAVLAFAIVCFFASAARADSFTFTGAASFGNDLESFFLSGPSLRINSAAPGGPANTLFICDQGATCKMPAQLISAFPSDFSGQGDFTGGTVGGVTADTLMGSLIFSGSSFIAGPGPTSFGSGPVTFTGDLAGFVFLPLGCEKSSTCTSVGPEVFHLHLSGTGTVTTSGEVIGQGLDGINLLRYNFSGTATTVPEPSSVLLVSSGLAGLAGMWRRLRWHPGK